MQEFQAWRDKQHWKFTYNVTLGRVRATFLLRKAMSITQPVSVFL